MATPSKKLQRMREQLMLEEDKRAGGAQREEAAKQALVQADSLSSHAARLRQMAAGMLRANAEAQAAAGQPGSQTGVPANQPNARRQPGLPQAGAAPRQALSGQPQAPAFYNKAARMRQEYMLQQDRMAGDNRQAAFPASSGGTAPLAYAAQNQLIQTMPPLTPAQQYAEKVVRYGLEGAATGGGRNSFSFAGDRRNAQVDPQKSAKQAAYFNNGAYGVSLPHTLPLDSLIASAGASDRGMPFTPEQRNYLAKLAASNPMYADPVNDDFAAAGRAVTDVNNAMLPLKGEAIALAQNTSYVKNGSNDDKEVFIGEILPKPGQDNKATTPPSPRPTPTPTPKPTPTPEPAPTTEPTPTPKINIEPSYPDFYKLMTTILNGESEDGSFKKVHGTTAKVDAQAIRVFLLGVSKFDYEGRLHYGEEYIYNKEKNTTGKYYQGELYFDCIGLIKIGIKASLEGTKYDSLEAKGKVIKKGNRLFNTVSATYDAIPKEEKGAITSYESFMQQQHPDGTAIFVDNDSEKSGHDHVYYYFSKITLINSKGEEEELENVFVGIGSSKDRGQIIKDGNDMYLDKFTKKLQVFDAAQYLNNKKNKAKNPCWGYVAPMN